MQDTNTNKRPSVHRSVAIIPNFTAEFGWGMTKTVKNGQSPVRGKLGKIPLRLHFRNNGRYNRLTVESGEVLFVCTS